MKKFLSSLLCAAMLLPSSAAVSGTSDALSAKDTSVPHQAYTLCYNTAMVSGPSGMNSGWVYDGRGAPVTSVGYAASLVDVSTDYGTAFIREFNPVTEGRVMLETTANASGDGAYLAFCDKNGNDVWRVQTVGGNWAKLNESGEFETLCANPGSSAFRVFVDLDRGTSETYIGGTFCGTHPLLSGDILSFRFGTDEKGTATLTPGTVHIEANYAVCEIFDIIPVTEAYGWGISGDVRSSGGLILNGGSSAKKEFSSLSGKVCAEAEFLADKTQTVSFTLNGGGDPVIRFASEKGKLGANGTYLRDLCENVYNRLRIEADLDAGKADILLNGRICGTVGIDADRIDSLDLTNESGTAVFDDIYVYNLIDVDDYVPEPVEKSDDEYLVGMNVCSLWVNGTHYGWACCTPFEDIEPVLGYYDEGNPECADWEIKFMADHGVDFQSFCWYCDNSQGAIRHPYVALKNQLHDGYMYAKYSNYMDYCIIWEAQSGCHFTSDFFRKYVVPYWFENYFLDERYVKIENRLLLPVFGAGLLAGDTYFGSPEAVKTEFEYLEKVARGYGFDGVIFLVCNDLASAKYESQGFDGAFAYNWGTKGSSLRNTKEYNIASAAYGNMETVPTVSVGFNNVGWAGTRSPLMTTDDFAKAQEWVIDEFLPGYTNETWSSNLVMISNWNEYGEGTYIMPAEGLCGFGYLDVLREYYSDLPEAHEDIVPTDAQKERINHLYPQYAHVMRRYGGQLPNLTYPEGIGDMYINGTRLENTIKPIVEGGVTLYPFDEGQAVSHKLGSFATWRKNEGTLKIEANGHTAVFTVGSDIMKADGREVKLANKVTLIDNIPMIDFKPLCEAMEWGYSVALGKAYITTHQMPEILKKVLRRDGAWEFESPLDPEGWSPSSMSCTVSDGKMTLTTTTGYRDPILRNSGTFALDASKYSDIEVRCRYTHDGGDQQIMQMFFLTDKDQSWSEGKSVRLPLSGETSGDDWYTVRVSLAECAGWKDTVTNLRFDPFNALGTMEIDYIRLIRDPATLVPGDATGDGRVNAKDAQTVMMLLAGWSVTADKASADADGDNGISAKDVMEILRCVTGWKK